MKGEINRNMGGKPKVIKSYQNSPNKLGFGMQITLLFMCHGNEEVSSATAESLMPHHACPLSLAAEHVAGLAIPEEIHLDKNFLILLVRHLGEGMLAHP